MSSKISKELSDFANERNVNKEQLKNASVQAENQALKTEEHSKEVFMRLTKEIITPAYEEARSAFEKAGDHIELMTPEQVTSYDDKARLFARILFYRDDKSRSVVGLNTPSLEFECQPKDGMVVVKMRTTMRPTSPAVVGQYKIDEFGEDEVNKEMLAFFKGMRTVL